ncbi:MAG: cupin domain-containing protein [Syntrophorhabdaceae bacterium]
MIRKENIFSRIPARIPDEIFETLAETDTIKIERIISDGHTTPGDNWYDQNFDEWVMVVKGIAEILFEDEADAMTLRPGDYMLIPACRRHRVIRTDENQPTIWLAIHMKKV